MVGTLHGWVQVSCDEEMQQIAMQGYQWPVQDIADAIILFSETGDLHDSKYDHLVHQQIWEEMADSKTSSYTGIPISTDFCPNLMWVFSK